MEEEEDEDYIVFYNSVIECGKRCQKYIYWVKKDLFGCFRIEEIVTKTMIQV